LWETGVDGRVGYTQASTMFSNKEIAQKIVEDVHESIKADPIVGLAIDMILAVEPLVNLKAVGIKIGEQNLEQEFKNLVREAVPAGIAARVLYDLQTEFSSAPFYGRFSRDLFREIQEYKSTVKVQEKRLKNVISYFTNTWFGDGYATKANNAGVLSFLDDKIVKNEAPVFKNIRDNFTSNKKKIRNDATPKAVLTANQLIVKAVQLQTLSMAKLMSTSVSTIVKKAYTAQQKTNKENKAAAAKKK